MHAPARRRSSDNTGFTADTGTSMMGNFRERTVIRRGNEEESTTA